MPFYKSKQLGQDATEEEELFDMRSEATSHPTHSATDFEMSTGISSAGTDFQPPLYNKKVSFLSDTKKLNDEYRNLRYKVAQLKGTKHVKDMYPVLNSLKNMCSRLFKEYNIKVDELSAAKKHKTNLMNQSNEDILKLRQEFKESSKRYKLKIKNLENEKKALNQTNIETIDDLTKAQTLIKMLREEKEVLYSEMYNHKKTASETNINIIKQIKTLDNIYTKKAEEFKVQNIQNINKIKELEKELYMYRNSIKYENHESFEKINNHENPNIGVSNETKEINEKLLKFING